jgi:hypothetical protein
MASSSSDTTIRVRIGDLSFELVRQNGEPGVMYDGAFLALRRIPPGDKVHNLHVFVRHGLSYRVQSWIQESVTSLSSPQLLKRRDAAYTEDPDAGAKKGSGRTTRPVSPRQIGSDENGDGDGGGGGGGESKRPKRNLKRKPISPSPLLVSPPAPERKTKRERPTREERDTLRRDRKAHVSDQLKRHETPKKNPHRHVVRPSPSVSVKARRSVEPPLVPPEMKTAVSLLVREKTLWTETRSPTDIANEAMAVAAESSSVAGEFRVFGADERASVLALPKSTENVDASVIRGAANIVQLYAYPGQRSYWFGDLHNPAEKDVRACRVSTGLVEHPILVHAWLAALVVANPRVLFSVFVEEDWIDSERPLRRVSTSKSHVARVAREFGSCLQLDPTLCAHPNVRGSFFDVRYANPLLHTLTALEEYFRLLNRRLHAQNGHLEAVDIVAAFMSTSAYENKETREWFFDDFKSFVAHPVTRADAPTERHATETKKELKAYTHKSLPRTSPPSSSSSSDLSSSSASLLSTPERTPLLSRTTSRADIVLQHGSAPEPSPELAKWLRSQTAFELLSKCVVGELAEKPAFQVSRTTARSLWTWLQTMTEVSKVRVLLQKLYDELGIGRVFAEATAASTTRGLSLRFRAIERRVKSSIGDAFTKLTRQVLLLNDPDAFDDENLIGSDLFFTLDSERPDAGFSVAASPIDKLGIFPFVTYQEKPIRFISVLVELNARFVDAYLAAIYCRHLALEPHRTLLVFAGRAHVERCTDMLEKADPILTRSALKINAEPGPLDCIQTKWLFQMRASHIT